MKVQKHIGQKNFVCGATNVVEHYGKRIEILHGPCHSFWQKSSDWLNWPFSQKDTRAGFNCFSIMFYYIALLVPHIKKLIIFLNFRTVCMRSQMLTTEYKYHAFISVGHIYVRSYGNVWL